jgi:hypothetical protein
MYQGNVADQAYQNGQNVMPLPPGWISQWDPRFQRWYFVDTSTGLSTWDDPRFPSTYAPPQSPSYNQAPASQIYNPKPIFVPGSSSNNGAHTMAPDAGPVSVIDPTVAVALELSQSVPSLMGPPDEKDPKAVWDEYKQYLRSIQDAQ